MNRGGPILSYMPPFTPVVTGFLVISTAVFLADLTLAKFMGISLASFLGLIPAKVGQGWVWGFVTYSLVHAGLLHILFNLFVIWSVGAEMELLWKSKLFFLYCIVCILGAGISHYVFAILMGGNGLFQPVVGASGLVYGLLLAFGIFFGDRLLYFAGIFPMSARYFVMILIAIELVSSVFYGGGNVSHLAHLGGIFFGFLFLSGAAWAKRRAPAAKGGGAKKRSKSSHLRLVGEEDPANENKDSPKYWN